jgi:23S rRNA (uracil1939-C5)-methyltransferase
VELTIVGLSHGGHGVARMPDGRVVFVPGVAPGDRVRAALDAQKSGALRARVLEVLQPAPSRVTPACAVASRCGGCDWMHVEIGEQAAQHARIVADLVSRAVGAPVPPVRVHAAPRPLAYRTRARLFVRAQRGRVEVGYRAARSREIVEPPGCAVAAPELFETARDVARACLAGARGEGEVGVAFGLRDGRRTPVIDLVWSGELPVELWQRLDREERIAGARVVLEGARAASTFGDPRPVQIGFDGLPIVLPPGGFAQPSDEGAQLLAARVRELARPAGGRVVELFSGSGTLSIALARDADRFSSIEIDADAVGCARDNLAARGLEGKLAVGDAEAGVRAKDADVVVLDPPRAGAPGATVRLAQARPKRIVYVSCDPATLARDARTLAGAGYRITALETVELFAQTSHVEAIAVLSRGSGRAEGGAPS